MRFGLRKLGAGIAAIGVTLVSAIWLFNVVAGPVIPHAKLTKLSAGMTQDQVTAILGTPTKIDDEQHWVYERGVNPGWVEINFDKDLRFFAYNDESP